MTNIQSTPLSTLRRARKIGAAAGLKYVYTGNVPGDEGENTYCSGCGNLIIGRYGFRINTVNLKDSKCSQCGVEMEGIV
jgi:pyruvate formate lyase activating enzyme